VGEGEHASAWADGIVHADAGAIYMGAGQAAMIVATLLDGGKPADLPVAVVTNASLPTVQIQYTTLRDLQAMAEAAMDGPALILLGPQFLSRVAVDQAVDNAHWPTMRRAAAG
jgi:uroporphyrin-III C-methyltransferase